MKMNMELLNLLLMAQNAGGKITFVNMDEDEVEVPDQAQEPEHQKEKAVPEPTTYYVSYRQQLDVDDGEYESFKIRFEKIDGFDCVDDVMGYLDRIGIADDLIGLTTKDEFKSIIQDAIDIL